MEFAAALNISSGGALLHTRSFFPVESIITVRIPLSPALGREHRDQTLRAIVLRFEPQAKGFNLAVQFCEPLIAVPRKVAASTHD